MAQNRKISASPGITLDATNVGQRAYSRLVSGVKTHFLRFRFRITETLAGGPATALRNAGSILGRITQIGLEDNGRDVANMSGRMARVLSEMVSQRFLSATRIANYANGAYALEESLIIPFVWPRSVSPIETAFVEREPKNALQAFVVWDNTATAAGNPLVATSTSTPSLATVTVEQVYDDDMTVKPIFIPEYRVISEPIAATVSNFPIYLKTTQFLRGVIIQQDTNIGEVEDIITSLAIRDDQRDYVGPNPVLWEDLVRSAEQDFAGNFTNHGFDGSAAATQPDRQVYLPVEFQENGRMSRVLNPRNQNLRLEVTGQVSATGGATSSAIRTLLMELTRWPGRTSEKIPFAA